MKCHGTRRLAVICVCYALIVASVAARSNQQNSTETIIERMMKNYNNMVLPQMNARNPVHVKIQLYVIGMKSSTEKKMVNHYSIDVIIQQMWYDFRLTHGNQKPITFSGDIIDKLWRPDIRALTEKKSYPTEILKSNKLLRIFPNGSVFASQRCSLVNYCRMDLTTFPFDSQKCSLVLESFSYSNAYLTLDWATKNISNSFQLSRDPNLEEFVFKSYKLAKREHHYGGTGSGTHDQLLVDFILYRPVNFYIGSLYVPIVLIVILSWMSFWIDYRSVPARTAIGITTVLTFVEVQMNLFKLDVPPGKELNWYDIYSQVCFAFVFLALIEYSVAQSMDIKYRLSDWYRVRQGNPDKYLLDYEDTVENPNTASEIHDDTRTGNFDSLLSKFSFKYLDYKHSKHREKYHVLDKMSKVIFPVSFFIFNILYFSIAYNHYQHSRKDLEGYQKVDWE